jgi:NADPH:quinone reductase
MARQAIMRTYVLSNTRSDVKGNSVNPVDVFIAAGGLKEMAEHEFPVTLGRDFAGVVEQVGSGVSGFRPGDEVFGFVLHANPAVRDGSWVELITTSEDNVAQKPRSVDFARAGAAPLAAITALAAFDALAPTEARPCSSSAPPAEWAASSSSSPRPPART